MKRDIDNSFLEIAKVLDAARNYSGPLRFDNWVTNQTVQEYGGLEKIAEDISMKNKKHKRATINQELRTIWKRLGS